MLPYTYLNNKKIFPFKNSDDLISYAIKEKKILIALHAGKIMRENKNLKTMLETNIGYADGKGAVIALRKKGYKCKQIPGCELWLKLIDKFYHSKKFYLVGSTEEVINQTVKKLKSKYQGINIVNYREGYIKSEIEKKKLIDDITLKKPDIVFVAMGSPKQELLMEEMSRNHKAIYQGLGGSFDLFVEKVPRAPFIFRKYGLEFFYRIIKQPKRILREKFTLLFLLKLISNKL